MIIRWHSTVNSVQSTNFGQPILRLHTVQSYPTYLLLSGQQVKVCWNELISWREMKVLMQAG